jgi:mRNA interferase MazF
LLQVVPLTANVERSFPWDALVTVEGEPARAMCNQVQTADRSRFRDPKGALSAEDMRRVDRALRIELALT